MTQDLEQNIARYIPLEREDLTIFLSKFKSLTLKKGDYFIKEGDRCDFIGYILKGCLMCSFNINGNEVIDEFALENQFMADYKNFLDNKPALNNIICLEDTELLVINRKDLNELYDLKHSFERVGRLIAESLFKNWHNKAISMLADDAATRYEKLQAQNPALLQRVPQYLIASYLGITPQSLSRIRNKK